ncbi:hypothetical protein EXIGLDRAFT_778535 [Exidia glandulosa HHB12029]|uniref:Uncharacterized protein n=1 Tax=Exidia glandulosa HHB12029 TaxID=1314781 RepID=A0A165CH53_EXIGL|nr:hypothetical protein EXIGLDRAFT_778535 [Exidia glandulosa HHB12029]
MVTSNASNAEANEDAFATAVKICAFIQDVHVRGGGLSLVFPKQYEHLKFAHVAGIFQDLLQFLVRVDTVRIVDVLAARFVLSVWPGVSNLFVVAAKKAGFLPLACSAVSSGYAAYKSVTMTLAIPGTVVDESFPSDAKRLCDRVLLLTPWLPTTAPAVLEISETPAGYRVFASLPIPEGDVAYVDNLTARWDDNEDYFMRNTEEPFVALGQTAAMEYAVSLRELVVSYAKDYETGTPCSIPDPLLVAQTLSVIFGEGSPLSRAPGEPGERVSVAAVSPSIGTPAGSVVHAAAASSPEYVVPSQDSPSVSFGIGLKAKDSLKSCRASLAQPSPGTPAMVFAFSHGPFPSMGPLGPSDPSLLKTPRYTIPPEQGSSSPSLRSSPLAHKGRTSWARPYPEIVSHAPRA